MDQQDNKRDLKADLERLALHSVELDEITRIAEHAIRRALHAEFLVAWGKDRIAQLDAEAAVLRTALSIIFPSVSGMAYSAAQRGEEHAARVWSEHARRILVALEADAGAELLERAMAAEQALLALVTAILRIEGQVPDSALNLGVYGAEVARAIELLGSERVKTAMGGLDTVLEARP